MRGRLAIFTLASMPAFAIALVAGACARHPSKSDATGHVAFRHALAESAKDRKPVLLTCVNDWDEWCRRLERETLQDREVRVSLERFHVVRIDPTQDPEITNRYDVYLFPTIVIVDDRGEELRHVAGFRTAPQLLRELARVGEGGGGRHAP